LTRAVDNAGRHSQSSGKAEGPTTMSGGLKFSDVFSKELNAIGRRRQRLGIEPEIREKGEIPVRNDFVDEVKVEREEQTRAWESQLVGLAFSGGGIRSATFNLGVLQGLASSELLPYVDYLSTVSGGGYIGSWLVAWIKREGDLKKVQAQLKPNRFDQASVDRFFADEKGEPQPVPANQVVTDEEPETIYHLRAYSNYLAPRLGLFSADSWVLISTYARNLLLNLLVLLPTVMAFLLVTRFLVWFYDPNNDRYWPTWSLATARITALVLVTVAIFFIAFSLLQLRRLKDATPKKPIRQITPLWLHLFILAELTLAMVLVCWLFSRTDVTLNPFSWKLKGSEWIETRFLPLARWVGGGELGTFTPEDGASETARNRELEALRNLPWNGFPVAIFFAVFVSVIHGFGYCIFFLIELAYVFYKPVRMRWGNVTWKAFFSGVGDALLRLVCGVLSGFVGGLLLFVALTAIVPRMAVYLSPPEQGASLVGTLADTHTCYTALVPGQVSQAGIQANIPTVAAVVAFGVPVLLIAFVIRIAVEVGLLGSTITEEVREWWASLGGWILIYALSWASLFAIALFGGWVVEWLSGLVGSGWLQTGLVSGWLVTSIAGVFAGKSPLTGSGGRNKALEILARIAPHVFVLGLIVFVSWLIGAVLPWHSEKHSYWLRFGEAGWAETTCWLVGCLILAGLAGWRVDINKFSLHGMYADRLIRCYLGASRPKKFRPRPHLIGINSSSLRQANPITGFDPNDDFPMDKLKDSYWGPYPLINTALNLVHGEELAWQERKAESFVLTPAHAGSTSTGYRQFPGFGGNLSLGAAVALSGAAASPNMGYHSSPAVTALLTVFNARLGAWLGNPDNSLTCDSAGPWFGLFYLWKELFGRTDARNAFVYLSDGGHFDNLGIYELVRRRCRYIIAWDAGADPAFTFWDLGSVIRKCRIDFGARIEIDVNHIVPRGSPSRSHWHVATGRIYYKDVDGGDNEGILIYIKSSLTGDEPSDVLNYASCSPSFPHEPTLDQFFTESQFESYRALGYHIARQVFCKAASDARRQAGGAGGAASEGGNAPNGILDTGTLRPQTLFENLAHRWYPPPPKVDESFLETTKEFIRLQNVLREDNNLRDWSKGVYGQVDPHMAKASDSEVAQLHLVSSMLQVMENVWLGLKLDDYSNYPLYSGWMTVLRRWSGSAIFQKYWMVLQEEFSEDFVNFCNEHLQLPKRADQPTRQIGQNTSEDFKR
jgi:hypothetical protein